MDTYTFFSYFSDQFFPSKPSPWRRVDPDDSVPTTVIEIELNEEEMFYTFSPAHFATFPDLAGWLAVSGRWTWTRCESVLVCHIKMPSARPRTPPGRPTSR